MVFTYLLTAQFVRRNETYLSNQLNNIEQLKEVNGSVRNKQGEMENLIESIRSLSDYNSHHLRASISRSLGIVNLYKELGEDLTTFNEETGYDMMEIINDSIHEFEETFREFDDRVKQLKAAK